MWNPFDRRSDNRRALDAMVSGLPRPAWVDDNSHRSSRFVHDALVGWSGSHPKSRPTGGMDGLRRYLGRQPRVTAGDIAELEQLRRSECGFALHAVVVLASLLDSFDVWSASETAHRVVPLDLAHEVRSVGLSAGQLQRAIDELGDRPGANLADNARVQELYVARSEALADRMRALISRVSAFRAYFGGVAHIQRDLEALRWIARHGEPHRSEFDAQAVDELRAADLAAARESMRTAAEQMAQWQQDQ